MDAYSAAVKVGQGARRQPRGTTASPVGRLLKQWRERRRISQLGLAVEAEISTRHLSFLETGRAQPSRDMVLLLSRVLEVPMRGRNELLTAAAFIQWLHRDLLRSGDVETRRLLDELLSYPDVPRQWRTLDLDASTAPFLAIELRKGDARFSFFTILASLGTPYDITLHELRVECFFAADETTAEALRRLASAP